jgi:hypothetical protein
VPAELGFGDALARLYEDERRLANPLRLDRAPPKAQATRLFAESEPDAWADAPIVVSGLPPSAAPNGPEAIGKLVDILSGRRGIAESGDAVAPDVQLHIDQFHLTGLDQWNAWAAFLRGSPRVKELELVPVSLSGTGDRWVLTGRWQGVKAGQHAVSPPLSTTLTLAKERIAAIHTQRADYTFVAGDFIVPQAAFAALLGQLLTKSAA